MATHPEDDRDNFPRSRQPHELSCSSDHTQPIRLLVVEAGHSRQVIRSYPQNNRFLSCGYVDGFSGGNLRVIPEVNLSTFHPAPIQGGYSAATGFAHGLARLFFPFQISRLTQFSTTQGGPYYYYCFYLLWIFYKRKTRARAVSQPPGSGLPGTFDTHLTYR